MTMNMAGFNVGNPSLGNMPMPNNRPNGAMRMPGGDVDEPNYEAKLNTFIYNYFCEKGQYESARALKNSGVPFDPPLVNSDINGAEDNMHTDSKDSIDKNRPDDLPDVKNMDDGQGGAFLLSWFVIFWDIYFAQRKDPRANSNSMQYFQHTQQQARLRQEQQQRMFQGGAPMMNNNQLAEYQMMRFQNGMQNDLRQRALQNNRVQPTPQQMQQLRMAQQLHPGNRRDPAMEMNGRPRTPQSGEHAPSPSKRQRMDGIPFDGPQMMPNGRGPPQGMPPGLVGGEVAALNANHLLMNNGINPGNLSDSQFASFQQQNPAVQQKSIQVYAQNLAKNQRQQSMSNAGGMSDQGSPIMDSGMGDIGAEYYGASNPTAMQMRGAPPPNVPNGAAGGNHALQDYQMQLMLLEQQNKKRLLMARQEQDTIGGGRPDGQPGMPGGSGFIPGMSPGSRGGPSPGPSDNKRGTPKMNQVGLPGGGSPMPDGSMRGSPGAMNFGQMNSDVYAQMNGNGMRPPPSSNPGFPGQQFSQQQMEQMARAQQAGRGMQNGWQPQQQGQPPMMAQPQPQQPAPMGTPQSRNTDMPPPQGVPNATNGRPASPAAPPTPQTSNKAAPKGKEKARDRKKPTKKNSMASVTATPVSEAETANPPTPTPATPSTPQHVKSFAPPKAEAGQAQANLIPGMANGTEQVPPQQPETAAMPFNLEGANDPYAIEYNNDLNNPDLLDSFDFEQFLQGGDGDFNFDPSAFDNTGDIEAGMTGT